MAVTACLYQVCFKDGIEVHIGNQSGWNSSSLINDLELWYGLVFLASLQFQLHVSVNFNTLKWLACDDVSLGYRLDKVRFSSQILVLEIVAWWVWLAANTGQSMVSQLKCPFHTHCPLLLVFLNCFEVMKLTYMYYTAGHGWMDCFCCFRYGQKCCNVPVVNFVQPDRFARKVSMTLAKCIGNTYLYVRKWFGNL